MYEVVASTKLTNVRLRKDLIRRCELGRWQGTHIADRDPPPHSQRQGRETRPTKDRALPA